MNIRVFGQQELVNKIVTGAIPPYSHLISIGNPPNGVSGPTKEIPNILKKKYKSILRLEFWDAEDECQINEGEILRLPELSDIEQAIKYYNSKKRRAKGFDIHCWRGIARSTAIAFILLYLEEEDAQKAAEKLIDIRRNAMPNKRMISLFDEKYGTNLSDFNNTIYKARFAKMRKELEQINEPEELEVVE